MLSIINLKSKGKKKKKIISKLKVLTKLKKLNVRKKKKVKILKKKKLMLKRFFDGNNFLDKKKNLILPMSKVKKLRVDSFNINDSFELKKALFSLIKLSQFLKTGSKSENSLEILPFFFQESFLVSSSVEIIKKKNSFLLGNKPFLSLTRFQEIKKRENIFKKLKKRKILKNLKKRVIVLKKPKDVSNKKSLFTNGLMLRRIKQFLKAGKRVVVLKKVPFSVVKRKTFPFRRKSISPRNFVEKKIRWFLKMRESRSWNSGPIKAKKENVSLKSKQRPVNTPIKNFVSSKDKKKEKNVLFKAAAVFSKTESKKRIKKSFRVEDDLVKRLSFTRAIKKEKTSLLKVEVVSAKSTPKKKIQ